MKQKLSVVINIFFITIIILVIMMSAIGSERKQSTGNADRGEFIILNEGSEISALRAIDGKVYAGTNRGVLEYNTSTLKCENSIEDLNLIYSAGITQTPDNIIWIGHEEGLTGIKPSGDRIEFRYPDLPKGRINAVEYDGESIWCGTYNGLARLVCRGGEWQVSSLFTSEDGLICDSANAILPTDNGLVIGSYLEVENGGISYINRQGQIQRIGVSDGLPHPYITSIVQYTEDVLMIGCGYMDDGGLAVLKYNPDEDEYYVNDVYSTGDGIPGSKVRCLFADDEYLFVTTEYDGIEVLNKCEGALPDFHSGLYLTEENGLSDNEIKCIVYADGYYWLGGKYGLTLIPKEYIDNKL